MDNSPIFNKRDNEAANDLWRSEQAQRFSFMLRPNLSIDGDKWCALLGENLQDGVAGFGSSPDEAYAAFDKAWTEKLPQAFPRSAADAISDIRDDLREITKP